MTEPASGSRALVGGALFALYVIWGSTYLAMQYALEGFPPLWMAAIRHASAGAILFAIAKLGGAPWPTARQWRGALIVGGLLLAGGNGCVAIAERSVSSSFAAMALASVPLWTAAVGLFYGERPTRRELIGMLVGFAGVIVLNASPSIGGDPLAFVAILVSPIVWSWGTILGKRVELAKGAMGTATQMLAGGGLLVAMGAVGGERIAAAPSATPIAAMIYLITIGSIVAFSAYVYLLRTTRPAVATSYAYVNPIVAIALGVALHGEEFSARAAMATVLTLLGVFIIASGKKK